MTLLHNQIFLLLTIIILGELLGRIRPWNLSLGPSAIIFVALAFGHFGVTLPQGVQTIGLALFIYAVGTSAGGSFVATLHERGLALLLSGALVTLLPVAVGVAIGLWLLRIQFLRLLGVLVGGMTNASGLAAAGALSPTTYTAAAYAMVYPVALIGKILAVKILLLLL